MIHSEDIENTKISGFANEISQETDQSKHIKEEEIFEVLLNDLFSVYNELSLAIKSCMKIEKHINSKQNIADKCCQDNRLIKCQIILTKCDNIGTQEGLHKN